MGKWDYSSVHGLNKYLWNRIKAELGWSESNYGGLVPITTPSQQPEFNSYNFPYIVYSYSPQATGPDWWLEGEIIAYTVYSTNTTDIRQIVNLIKAVFNMYDDSAREVNNYLNANGSVDNKAFDYKTISVTSANGPQPPLSEGGRQDGTVVIRSTYTQHDAAGKILRY